MADAKQDQDKAAAKEAAEAEKAKLADVKAAAKEKGEKMVTATLRNRFTSSKYGQSFGPGEDIQVPESVAQACGYRYGYDDKESKGTKAAKAKAAKK